MPVDSPPSGAGPHAGSPAPLSNTASDTLLDALPNPMNHPDELPAGTDGTPHFGRLLLVLAAAVMLIVAVTFASQAWFS